MGLLTKKAPKGLLASAQKLQKMGNGGDSILAHIGPKEALMLKQAGGAGTINKKTGLLQFEEGAGDAGSGDSGSGSGVGTGGPGDAAGGTGAGAASGVVGGLKGTESTTAVEGGGIPGTPDGTAAPNSIGQAAAMGVLGQFGQPDLGPLNGVINGLAENVNGVLQGNPNVMGKMAINGLIGVVPGLGLANSISGLLGGPTVGGLAIGALNGNQGVNAGSPIGGGISDGPAGPSGSGAPGSDFKIADIPLPRQAPNPFVAPQVNPLGLPALKPFAFGQTSGLLAPTNPLFQPPRGLLGR